MRERRLIADAFIGPPVPVSVLLDPIIKEWNAEAQLRKTLNSFAPITGCIRETQTRSLEDLVTMSEEEIERFNKEVSRHEHLYQEIGLITR